MAVIQPFRALRPVPGLAVRVCELPYDVVSSAEARTIAAGNPLSFFHVSKPEIDFSDQIDPCDPRVYEKGKENFLSLSRQHVLLQDPQPRFYIYRQIANAHIQTGIVAGASCADYLTSVIKKH